MCMGAPGASQPKRRLTAGAVAPGGGQYAGYCDFACGYCAPPPPPPPAAEAAALARCPQVDLGVFMS
jgi:hypothetical protein